MKNIINLDRKKLVICLTLLIIGVCILPGISGEENGNSAPIADAGGPYTGYEGSILSLDASGSYDPDGDNLIYNWDLDDDTFVEFREWLDSPLLDWIWYDDFHGTITVFVIDDHGVMDSDTALVDIYNVAPTITSFEGLSNEPIPIGASVELSSEFTDPGIFDTHEATVDWGDGTLVDAIVDEYSVDCSHTYEEAGVYTVTLTIIDDDGGIDIEIFQYIVVYNPESGFVTGGGWIDTPEGAYTPDPTLTGKATFGFISKYQKGKSTPSGNTEFQFHAAGMNFHSKTYDWLVIAGAKAMYKGNGTIDNEGNYGFKLTAIDEELTPNTDVDLFRIKIWDKDNENEVIYDNMIGEDEDEDPTTEISGGQIKIHSK